MQRRLLSGHNIGTVQMSEWSFPWSRWVLVLFPSPPGYVPDWLSVPGGVQSSFIFFMFSVRNSPPSVYSCWRRICRSLQRDSRRRARWCFPPGESSRDNNNSSSPSHPPVLSPQSSHRERERDDAQYMCWVRETARATENWEGGAGTALVCLYTACDHHLYTSYSQDWEKYWWN